MSSATPTATQIQYGFSEPDYYNRDAVEGVSLIANGLDHACDLPELNNESGIADLLGIALGWAALISVIYHPELQVGAITVAAVYFAGKRSFRSLLSPAAV